MPSTSSLVPALGGGAPRPTLRDRLEKPGLTTVPVIFDAMSARVAFEASFDVLSIGSLALSASKFALPDTGFITLNDMAEHVQNVRAAVPESVIIADGESGFGNAAHVVRSVKTLEASGANAVHIEDQLFGKHVTVKPWMETAKVTADKIAAAASARTSDDFIVIARTDTHWATSRNEGETYGPEEAIRRSNLYVEAGADMILLPVLPLDQMASVVAEINAPVMTSNAMLAPEVTWTEIEETGIKVVLYFDLGINAAITGMRRVMQGLAASQTLSSVIEHMTPNTDIDKLMGSEELHDIAVRFEVFPD